MNQAVERDDGGLTALGFAWGFDGPIPLPISATELTIDHVDFREPFKAKMT